MAAVAQLGGHTFDDNECSLVSVSRTSNFSPRNRRLTKQITMQCQGEFLGEVSDLIAKIQSFENAVRSDNVDFRFSVNGSLAHALTNSSDCLSGVKVVSHSYPKHEDGELATARTFAFVVQATYEAMEDDLVFWQESITKVGTGGPRFYILESADSIPIGIITTTRSVVQYIQSGTAVGYASYPVPPGPVLSNGNLPGGVLAELEPEREITHVSGRQIGNAIRFYTTKWKYKMFRDPSTFGQADFLPTSK